MSTNEKWIDRLGGKDAERDLALSELRTILVRGLNSAIPAIRSQYDNRVPLEDVVQEALIKVLKKLHTFEGRSKFTTWATTIAIRIAVSSMRRRNFHDVSIESPEAGHLGFEVAEDGIPGMEENEEKDKVMRKLRQLIDSELTLKQKEAIHALLVGMPVEVIAEKTGSNRNAVYKLIHDARTKLRNGFEKAGLHFEDIAAAIH